MTMYGNEYVFNPTPVKISTPVQPTTYDVIRKALQELVDANIADCNVSEELGYARAVLDLTN